MVAETEQTKMKFIEMDEEIIHNYIKLNPETT